MDSVLPHCISLDPDPCSIFTCAGFRSFLSLNPWLWDAIRLLCERPNCDFPRLHFEVVPQSCTRRRGGNLLFLVGFRAGQRKLGMGLLALCRFALDVFFPRGSWSFVLLPSLRAFACRMVRKPQALCSCVAHMRHSRFLPCALTPLAGRPIFLPF